MKTVCTRFSLNPLVCLLLLFLLGCVSKTPKWSGFLADYGDLQADPNIKGLYVYRKPLKSAEQLPAKYTRFFIDPVIVYLHPDSLGRGIDPGELKFLTEYFRQELIGALKKSHVVSDIPGPDVVRIRVAITGVKATKPRLSYHPADTALSLDEASIEVEFLDSKTADRLLALVDSRQHSGGIDLQRRLMKKRAKAVIQKWVKLIRAQLDEAFEVKESK
ncbi:MAG: DUF3313 domain-containing protein [Deltaproteobacteria bacterium]|nr:DUF3313 domain-containing protein [Deltaproteobacteria bacterium]MBW1961502.1 DUF3313 domain-containing protein [Deltaproteobacteria bacterium]MBW1993649.1 DUF3313 domain-containing protein [Deltaproteobacteria bacterium]MBW2150684.1 DUF3313 domain-containing protein [Deltaproteobacteria bacterium]